jgi:hypothetical protein
VKLHRLGVGEGQREGGADAARRTNCAEQKGALVALVGGLARSRSTLGPLLDTAVFLIEAGFVLT